MEVIIAILLLVVIYQLSQIKTNVKDKSSKRSSPAFTRKEWDEAVNTWYSSQYDEDAERGLVGKPGWSIWSPPPYDEVKDNPEAIEQLRVMAGLDKN